MKRSKFSDEQIFGALPSELHCLHEDQVRLRMRARNWSCVTTPRNCAARRVQPYTQRARPVMAHACLSSDWSRRSLPTIDTDLATFGYESPKTRVSGYKRLLTQRVMRPSPQDMQHRLDTPSRRTLR